MKKFFTIIVVLLMVGGCAWAYYNLDYLKELAPNDERISTTEFFDVSGDEVALMYNYTLQETKGVYKNSNIYLPLDWVRACLNDDFYWDESANVLIYALPDRLQYSDLETKGSDGSPFLIMNNGKVCISLPLIKSYTDIVAHEFVSDEAKRVFINSIYGEYTCAAAGKKTLLRTGDSIKQRGIIDIEAGEKLRILKDGDWVRVYSEKGYTGYLNSSDLSQRTTETLSSSGVKMPERVDHKLDGKVLLAWHQITNQSANATFEGTFAKADGVNVVSPTWFFVSDESGNCDSLVSTDYITAAHARGMQVWALVDNYTYQDLNTTKLLKSMNARKKLIAFLVDTCLENGIDGINVDFEQLTEADSDAFAQFIKELSVSCENNALVLSVDNPNTANYNLLYRRDVQARFCDYVINMGYDEHWDGSDAGPVASHPFVVEGLELALNEVPKEKLINGVPFYTRIWTVSGGTTTSQAVGFDIAKEWASTCEADPVWKADMQCYYYVKGSERCWMENSETLKKKVELCNDLDLAGIACWKMGLESADVWEILSPAPIEE